MARYLSVYDGHTKKRLAYLQNAHNISYNKSTNALWTAEFTLPYTDPKSKYCEALNLVEIWDEDAGGAAKYVGLFRILPRTEEIISTGACSTFQLEHVLSTLFDDVLLGYHEIGNTGVFTPECLNYILERQTEKRWVLEQCDYKHQFLYGWQNENLLSALFSIVQPFEETDYYWSFDTTAFPWRISLLSALKKSEDSDKKRTAVTDIRYRKNLNGVTRTVDPSNLATRLYCYGFGDGDNVLGISEINDGVPYLDSPNITKYGVITQIWTDERFTVAESLKQVGEAMLKKLSEPSISYDLDIQTVHSAQNLGIGDTVRVVTSGIDEYMIVNEITKSDLTGARNSGKIKLGAATIDISSSIAELADRQRISESYSQGAESIFTDSYSDNADDMHPAEITIQIPENAVHVNEIMFTCKLAKFRAYSRATKGGGGQSDTTTEQPTESLTSNAGGSSTLTSGGGGSFNRSSSSGGGGYTSAKSRVISGATALGGSGSAIQMSTDNLEPNDNVTTHNHGIASDAHLCSGVTYSTDKDGKVTSVTALYPRNGSYWVPSGGHKHRMHLPSHQHNVSIPAHTHDVDIEPHAHYVSVEEHTHSVVIPTHQHTVVTKAHSHKFTVPNHTHDIQYGIYEGKAATGMSIYLDDTKVGEWTDVSGITGLNLIDYMSKNANGKIMRGAHTIRVVPNALTRVECMFQIRLFTNMHGGSQH